MNNYNAKILNGVPFYWNDIEFIQSASYDAINAKNDALISFVTAVCGSSGPALH
jgi:hypothetical protein